MAYKNDSYLVIANKFSSAGSDAKAQLWETYDKLRDLTIIIQLMAYLGINFGFPNFLFFSSGLFYSTVLFHFIFVHFYQPLPIFPTPQSLATTFYTL